MARTRFIRSITRCAWPPPSPRGQLTRSAAEVLGTPLPKLKVRDGVILAADGREVSYGSLTGRAAVSKTRVVLAQLKPRSEFNLVGTPQRRIDALAAVTGRKTFAQGIGVHHEYKGYAACVAEIDCTPATVHRHVRDGYTGPRVRKVVFAVDVGLPINPLGLKAQMMGGIMDGIAQALTYSLHLKNGHFLEGSWDNAYYTREWNVPFDVQVIVMPPTTTDPGGAGELGVAASMSALANAYARATGRLPTSFPINHGLPLGFTPLPTVPPIPQSPTDGLSEVF